MAASAARAGASSSAPRRGAHRAPRAAATPAAPAPRAASSTPAPRAAAPAPAQPLTQRRAVAAGAVQTRNPLDMVATAAVAATEVSRAVRERGVQAPDAVKSFVARGEDTGVVRVPALCGVALCCGSALRARASTTQTQWVLKGRGCATTHALTSPAGRLRRRRPRRLTLTACRWCTTARPFRHSGTRARASCRRAALCRTRAHDSVAAAF
jgi:hypothetical protein